MRFWDSETLKLEVYWNIYDKVEIKKTVKIIKILQFRSNQREVAIARGD